MRAETPFSTWMRVLTSIRKGSPLQVTRSIPRCRFVIAHLAGHGQGIVHDIRKHAARVERVFQFVRREAGRDLDAFLQARGLDGAVARAEVHGVRARAVRNDLHFQVVEIRDALLNEHAFVLELAQGVIADAPVDRTELVRVVDFLDAHAAAARRGLDQHQRALDALLFLEFKDRLGDALGLHLVVNGAVRTGHRGHAQAAGQAFGIDFVAQLTDDFPGGADEDQFAVAFGDPAGETEILGEKAVARMHGGAAGLVGNGHQFVGVVIGGHAEQAFSPAFLAGQADMAGRRASTV